MDKGINGKVVEGGARIWVTGRRRYVRRCVFFSMGPGVRRGDGFEAISATNVNYLDTIKTVIPANAGTHNPLPKSKRKRATPPPEVTLKPPSISD